MIVWIPTCLQFQAAQQANRQRHGTSVALICVKMASVMGVSWILGIAANLKALSFLWYPYVVLNSLQGTYPMFCFPSFMISTKLFLATTNNFSIELLLRTPYKSNKTSWKPSKAFSDREAIGPRLASYFYSVSYCEKRVELLSFLRELIQTLFSKGPQWWSDCSTN